MKLLIVFSLILSILSEDCTNFNDNYSCSSSDVHEFPSDWGNRMFQTPPRGSKDWKPSYQDMNLLVGYVQQKYSANDEKVTLVYIYSLNTNSLPLYSYPIFMFGEKESKRNTIDITKEEAAKYPNGMKVSVQIVNYLGHIMANVDADPVFFKWNNPAITFGTEYKNGQRGAIVEFFGWPFKDIEKECTFISKAGYLGIRVSPSIEHIETYELTENGELNPWYYIYQPVSYRHISRFGSKEELKQMLDTCRSKNVAVYADTIIYHMSVFGNDTATDHRELVNGQCIHYGPAKSSGNSAWYTGGYLHEKNSVTNMQTGIEFPSVPYGPLHFHCKRDLNNYSNKDDLNYGWLNGLIDLKTEDEYVRQRLADYLTDLLSIGFSGFKISGAKHLSPADLGAIFAKLKDNLGGTFPNDFIAYLEVMLGGEADLLMCKEGDYNYGPSFVKQMKEINGLTDSDINKIKIIASNYPKEFPKCGDPLIVSKERYVLQVDSHDDQFNTSSSRGIPDETLVLSHNSEKHRQSNINLFNYKYNDNDFDIKLLLSSYSFSDDGALSPPDGKSDCSKCESEQCKNTCTKSMPYSEAYDPNSKGYDCGDSTNWIGGVYTRVHRDLNIINAMRNWMGLSELKESDLYPS